MQGKAGKWREFPRHHAYSRRFPRKNFKVYDGKNCFVTLWGLSMKNPVILIALIILLSFFAG